MSVQQAENILKRSIALRVELKAWEKRFAAANNGRKAGRDDIKRDASIATKYREYTKLRELASGKEGIQRACELSPSQEPSRKKRRIDGDQSPSTHRLRTASAQTPKKWKDTLRTPSKTPHPAIVDPYDSPSAVRKLQWTSPYRTVIGPTPQRNGKLLGLFDLLEEEGDGGCNAGVSPSKPGSVPLADLPLNYALSTPRKDRSGTIATPLKSHQTPRSSAKRSQLTAFVTPSKRKSTATAADEDDNDETLTPAFLRRDGVRQHSHPNANANADVNGPGFDSPVAIRMPVKPPLRGLSQIVAGLRKMEDERLDEEMDIMRQMEMEREGAGTGVKKVALDDRVAGVAVAVEGEDNGFGDRAVSDVSQTQNEILGDEGEQKPVKEGPPARVWKKRGQKRTTKRVILRPSRPKPQSQTQPSGAPSDPRYEEDNDDDDNDDPLNPEPNKPPTTTTNTSAANPATAPTQGPATKLVKAARKVSAQAHANFKRLKLRSKGAKGASGGGRRFGRGRR